MQVWSSLGASHKAPVLLLAFFALPAKYEGEETGWRSVRVLKFYVCENASPLVIKEAKERKDLGSRLNLH